MVPSTPSGSGGERLMSLPLRDAREIFEREYLIAQIATVFREHLAHRGVHRNGALGAAPQTEVVGGRLGRQDVAVHVHVHNTRGR